MGACAKPNADEMVTRKINDKDAFGLCIHRAGAARMREVDDQPEAFEGYGLEESTIPPLRLTSARVTMSRVPHIPVFCGAGGPGGIKPCTLSSATSPPNSRNI
jgi:hypothetical protein